MWKDKLFWFSQPALTITDYDKYFLWLFAGLLVLGVLVRLSSRFLVRHPIRRKLLNKFGNAGLYMGLVGLLWFAIRYENTPIFSARFWAGLTVLIFIIWLFFIIKYWFSKFGTEKNSYDKVQLNSKYIPSAKR
jgi:hypothetical protein